MAHKVNVPLGMGKLVRPRVSSVPRVILSEAKDLAREWLERRGEDPSLRSG